MSKVIIQKPVGDFQFFVLSKPSQGSFPEIVKTPKMQLYP